MHIVKIKSISNVTPDVLRIIMEKPETFSFIPGQATEVAINKEKWKDESRPFTFTSLPPDNYLEFTIKTYPFHKGVTNQLRELKEGDELILHDIFGTITYKGEGIFIAGGAGVTPFISIFRDLDARNEIGNNKLIFANKTKADIIYEDMFRELLGENFINVLSDVSVEGYKRGFITEELIKQTIDGPGKYFYLCGPPPMMDSVEKQFSSLGIDQAFIVKESF